MSDKELAIKVAEKLNTDVQDFDPHYTEEEDNKFIDKYLHDKAAEILFSEGMREKIDKYLEKKLIEQDELYIDYSIRNWWREDEGEDFIERLLSTWLEMEDE